MANKTEVVFILDKSGSMSGMEADTIGGFNSMIEEQKKEEGELLVTTIMFSNAPKMVHDRVSIQDVTPLTIQDYIVGGCTALLDTIGTTINHIKEIHKYARPEDIPDKTLFFITTDGMENASHQFTYDQIQKLTKEREEAGWQFVFVAANIDPVQTAVDLGIDAQFAGSYEKTPDGMMEMYRCASERVSCCRAEPKNPRPKKK